MKKVMLSLLMALTVSFAVLSSVVYAAASEPSGELSEASFGDYFDNDEVIDFLATFLYYVSQANSYASSSDDPVDVIKGVLDDMFVEVMQAGISLLPGGDFINLISGWVGLYDFSITDHFSSKFQDLFNSGTDDMQEFYDLCILPCYGSVDNFVDDIYGDNYDPEPGVISTGDTMANIGEGASSFISGVLTPIGEYCVNSEICLAFLAVCFAALGVRVLRRSVGAFGRGR